MMNLPRVAVFITGGTIDSLGKDRLDNAYYLEHGQRLETDELLRRVPEMDTIADVEIVPFRRITSQAMVDADWLELLHTLTAILARDDVAGAVVTHGTNTLEETAYFLNLSLKSEKPVVLVGSMRPASALSADGYLNLLNAVRVAACPTARGRGCLVVLNDTIFQARDVTKTSTYRLEAFQSNDLGPLGFADSDGQVLFYHRPERRHTIDTEFDLTSLSSLPRVDVVLSYNGADDVMAKAAVAAGARGLVCAATGAGRPTPAQQSCFLELAREGVAVCISSRINSGRIVWSPGFRTAGFLASDNLSPWKARILLSLALSVTQDTATIQEMFDAY